MKFALNVVALLVVAFMVPKTAPIKSFSEARRKFVLDVSANDHIWAKHLDVGIKIDPNNLSAAAREVLMYLDVETAKVAAADQPALKPGVRQIPIVGMNTKRADGMTEEKAQEPQLDLLVVRALHVVIEVASRYDKHGMAVDFALDAIASAFKCKTLMYIQLQLYSIEKTHELQFDAVTSHPFDVWDTLIHVLDKVAALKESLSEEFELYQRWELVVGQLKHSELPSDFKQFQVMIDNTLEKSCDLSTFEQIKKDIKFEKDIIFESTVDTIELFTKCQSLLKDMLKSISISKMDISVWEAILGRKKLNEKSEPPLATEI